MNRSRLVLLLLLIAAPVFGAPQATDLHRISAQLSRLEIIAYRELHGTATPADQQAAVRRLRDLKARIRMLSTDPSSDQLVAVGRLREKLERAELMLRQGQSRQRAEQFRRQLQQTVSAQPAEAGGSITGRVTDGQTKFPLQGIGVTIYDSSGQYVNYYYTDSSGIYTAGGLSAGTYYAVAWDSTQLYEETLYRKKPLFPGWQPTDGKKIKVAAGRTTSRINFPLIKMGSIAGTIVDSATSAPLAGVQVTVYDHTGEPVTQGVSDSQGKYMVNGLLSGVYFAVTSNTSGYVDQVYGSLTCIGWCDARNGTPVSVKFGQATTGIDFALGIGGSISGSITTETGDLPWVFIDLWDSGGNPLIEEQGSDYMFTGLPAGNYFVSIGHYSAGDTWIEQVYNDVPCNGFEGCDPTTGTPVPVTPGATTTGINFVITMGRASISGSVRDAATAQPIPGVKVYIFDPAEKLSGNYGYADDSGNYSIGTLTGGQYNALAVNWQYTSQLYDHIDCNGFCEHTAGTPITVPTPTSSVTGINFDLDAGGTIQGTVVDAGNSSALSGVNVYIFDSTGALARSTFTSSGNFSATGLPTGNYYAITMNEQGYIDEAYANVPCLNCDPTTGTPIPVTMGSTTSGVNFALEKGGSISGTVFDAKTSVPVLGNLDLYDAAGKLVFDAVGSDAFGAFQTVRGLPSGNYYLKSRGSKIYAPEIYRGVHCAIASCDVTAGTPIAVTKGAVTSGINLALDKGGIITGKITRASNGLPLKDATVSIVDATGAWIGYGVSSADGTFSAGGLASGSYFAFAYDDGFRSQLYNNIPCDNGKCDFTNGTPIPVTLGGQTPGVNFPLIPVF